MFFKNPVRIEISLKGQQFEPILARLKDKSVPGPIQIGISLEQEQFQPILEKLRERPPLDTWNKILDIVYKAVISIVLGAVSGYFSYQEFHAKQTDLQAKIFAGFFAKDTDKRLEAAAAAANDLKVDEIRQFVRLAVARFDDTEPNVPERTRQGIVDMTRTCYARDEKVPVIVDVLAEGLSESQAKNTQLNAAQAATQIGLPRAALLTAAGALLSSPNGDKYVLKEVCTCIENLKWDGSSQRTLAKHVSALRQELKEIKEKNPFSGVRDECERALNKLP